MCFLQENPILYKGKKTKDANGFSKKLRSKKPLSLSEGRYLVSYLFKEGPDTYGDPVMLAHRQEFRK